MAAQTALGDNRIAYDLNELSRLTPFSRRTLERAVVAGALKTRKIGGRRIVLRADALRWLSRDHPAPGAEARQ